MEQKHLRLSTTFRLSPEDVVSNPYLVRSSDKNRSTRLRVRLCKCFDPVITTTVSKRFLYFQSCVDRKAVQNQKQSHHQLQKNYYFTAFFQKIMKFNYVFVVANSCTFRTNITTTTIAGLLLLLIQIVQHWCSCSCYHICNGSILVMTPHCNC